MTRPEEPGCPDAPRPVESGSGEARPTRPDATEPRGGPSADDAPAAEEYDAVRRLLGETHDVRRRQVSSRAGATLLSARRFWHALGFPALGDDDMAFTDADLDALDRVVALTREGVVEESMALAMTRAMARTADRLASWQVSLVMEAVLDAEGVTNSPDVTDVAAAVASDHEADEDLWHRGLTPETSARVAELVAETADSVEPLLVYAWRRHLAATIGQLTSASDDEGAGEVQRTVGFADMVGFTSLVSRLSERQLAVLVQRFEELATDVVTAHGGRVVKTLGDEVVFTAARSAPAAAIALDLIESMTEDGGMPGLRIGMATGRILTQLGDVYGTTVNRASRLCGVAPPDGVVIDDGVAHDLTSVSGFEMRRLSSRPLRGLGVTGMWELRRTAVPTRRGPMTSG